MGNPVPTDRFGWRDSSVTAVRDNAIFQGERCVALYVMLDRGGYLARMNAPWSRCVGPCRSVRELVRAVTRAAA